MKMKIIIDIPDEAYEDVKKAGGCYCDFGKAILHGTPLPKGYGDLIDRSKLETHYVGTDIGTDLEVYLVPTIDEAPTIVEADTESEENDDIENMLEHLWNDYDKEDAISRQAVLECFTWTNDKADIWNRIKELPSATSYQRIGRWIRFKNMENGYHHIKCSECGQHCADVHAKTFKYCFNCGAKMGVEK